MATRRQARLFPDLNPAGRMIDAGDKIWVAIRLTHTSAAAADLVVVKVKLTEPGANLSQRFGVTARLLLGGELRLQPLTVSGPVAFSKADARARLHDYDAQVAILEAGNTPLLKLKRGEELLDILPEPSQPAAASPAAAPPASRSQQPRGDRERSRSPEPTAPRRTAESEPTASPHQVCAKQTESSF